MNMMPENKCQNLTMITMSSELDDVKTATDGYGDNKQEFQMQLEMPPSESALAFEEFFGAQNWSSMPVFSVHDRNMDSELMLEDDCSLMNTLKLSNDAKMDTSCTMPMTIACPVNENSDLIPLCVSPIAPTVQTGAITPTGVVTPTSGPTPIMTPLNSMPSSPSGSMYSGYSSGWGPPSPPAREQHRKKRGAYRGHTRASINTPVTTIYSSFTPTTSPRQSITTSPSEPQCSFVEESSDSKKDVSSSSRSTPRHKRPSHIRAEHKRRNKIQNGIEDLKNLIPSVAEVCKSGGKESKAAILSKTVDHCRELRQATKEGAREVQKLQAELESLTLCINELQTQLPDEGATSVNVTGTEPSQNINQMFQDYVSSRSLANWKFWIFGKVIRPLFDSYTESVVTGNQTQFCASVLTWLDKTCSLVSLRPIVFKALRCLSKETSILTTPEKLQQEAVSDVMQANFSDAHQDL